MAHISSETIEFSRLRKIREKINRYESHKQFVTECREKKLVPSGFRLKWRMDFDTSKEEERRMEEILHRASLSLLEEGNKVCERIIAEQKEKQKQTLASLKFASNQKHFEKKITELDAHSLQVQINLLRTKKKKLKQLIK